MGVPVVAVAGDGAQGQDGGDDADGHVDEEDRAPAEGGGEDAAEEHAGGDAHAADGAPDGQGGGALLAGVGGDDDGQGGGGEHGGAGALCGAGQDHGRGRGGGGGDQGRGGEDGQPGQEHGAAVEEVGEPAAEEQQAAGEQDVGGDDPLVVAAGERQGLPDGREGDVHDGDVEDDHELGHQHQAEDGPGTPGLGLGFVVRVVSTVRVGCRLALVTVIVADAMCGVGDRRWGGVVRHGDAPSSPVGVVRGLVPVASTLPSEPLPSRRANRRVHASPSLGVGLAGLRGRSAWALTNAIPVSSPPGGIPAISPWRS